MFIQFSSLTAKSRLYTYIHTYFSCLSLLPHILTYQPQKINSSVILKVKSLQKPRQCHAKGHSTDTYLLMDACECQFLIPSKVCRFPIILLTIFFHRSKLLLPFFLPLFSSRHFQFQASQHLLIGKAVPFSTFLRLYKNNQLQILYLTDSQKN